jgi:PHP family Zn ribbon phosphoesterase
MTCGVEGWAEAMYFCPTDGMWVCRACTVRFGLADLTPRCPRCHGALETGVATPADDVVAIGSGSR